MQDNFRRGGGLRWKWTTEVVRSGAFAFGFGDGEIWKFEQTRGIDNDRILGEEVLKVVDRSTKLYVVNTGSWLLGVGKLIVELESLSSWNFGCQTSWRGRLGRQAAKESAPQEKKSQGVA